MSKLKILFLAANPLATVKLQLDEEARAIDEALRKAEYRDHFELETHWAVRVDDLQGLLLRHKPHIVHFSGHGSADNEIILQDHKGRSVTVPPVALGMLFQLLKDNIRCVVLNACYSAAQAQAIAQQIDSVVGMSDAITDRAAREFAASFYQGLAYGRTVKEAHGLGSVQIALHGLGEEHKPQLLGAADAATVRLVDPAQVAEEEAASRTNSINTGGGAYIGGSVQLDKGDFVGRDKVIHGDEIRGDKFTGDKIMNDKVEGNKTGSDNISVGNISGGTGIAIGRGATSNVTQSSTSSDPAAMAALFAPLLAAIQEAPTDVQNQATPVISQLQAETAKGQQADDETMGGLIQDLADLVPSAVSAIGTIFAGPVLGNLVGPATKFVLNRLKR